MTCEVCGRKLRATNKYGVCNQTKDCRTVYNRRYERDHPRGWSVPYVMLSQIKQRAKRQGIPFSLTTADLPPVPFHCPVLGIPLERNLGSSGASANSPSLDRIRPELGYVPGNVQWLSYKANAMKNNASPEELLRFAAWVLANVQS